MGAVAVVKIVEESHELQSWEYVKYGINIIVKYLFEKALNPLYNKVCKIVRGPIPNSTVHTMDKEERCWHRVNDKLLTIKEAKTLGKEYEDKGYKVKLSLSEF